MIPTKEIKELVIYENGERREIAEPVKIFEKGEVVVYVPAFAGEEQGQ